jgi:hypothetical protein
MCKGSALIAKRNPSLHWRNAKPKRIGAKEGEDDRNEI